MTDNEIIKALECCGSETNSCKGCPLSTTHKTCIPTFSRNALNLINRQKAEIESLESRVFALNDTNRMLMNSQDVFWKNKVQEFAERLKDIYRRDKRYDRPNAHTLIVKLFDNIDTLVEELTEKGGAE